ncbi:hypothetical protein WH96_05525 [Kiloniella spongiae]|uniref:Uncharacterized protein n=1 Tax=Kiloniella spongiae TaxID=1489064 RepID=A0A0H2MGP0_9PROT|nr:hypothetical protein [Kiloniella spongiae]KLN61759.1 hypothetical protein WH96_05525 [Kiloniella spongiae]
MKKLLIALFILASIAKNSAHAVELDGANAPQFKEAIKAWLDDDDKTSLPLLAELAKNGNVAARLTLSGIERIQVQSISKYFKSLNRKEQRSLMRSEKGLSGTSWERVEAEKGNSFAITMRKIQEPLVQESTIRELINIGEHEAASKAISRMPGYGTTKEIISLANDNLVSYERRHLIWQSAVLTSDKKYINEAKQELKRGNPLALMSVPYKTKDQRFEQLRKAIYHGYFVSPFIKQKQAKELKNWTMATPVFRPIKSLCRAECPSQYKSCTIMANQLISSYDVIAGHDTPLESVISQNTYLKSKRSRNTLLRYILQRRIYKDLEGNVLYNSHHQPTSPEDIRAASSCLADKLTALEH